MKMELFACATTAIKKDFLGAKVETSVSVILASSESEGKVLAMRNARKNFPLSEGWLSHAVTVIKVPEDLIKQVVK